MWTSANACRSGSDLLRTSPAYGVHRRRRRSARAEALRPLYCALLFPLLLLTEHPCQPLIDFRSMGRLKRNLSAGLQERPDLIQTQSLGILHADFQSPACGLRSSPGSFCVRNTSSVQAHSALDKTPVCTSRPCLIRLLELPTRKNLNPNSTAKPGEDATYRLHTPFEALEP